MTVEDLIIRMKVVGSRAAAGEIRDAEGATKRTASTAKVATGGLAALALGMAAAAGKAVEWQRAQAQVAGTLRNLHEFSQANMDAVTGAAESFATHGGFDPETNLTGMTRLLTAHLSVSQAIRDQTLATDMARRANIPYNTAIRAVMNVEQGRTTGLGRLGVVLPKITTAQDRLAASHHKVTAAMREAAKAQDVQAMKVANLRELWKRFGGAAEQYSNTAAGRWSNLQHQVGNLARSVGTTLLPVIEKFAGILSTVVGRLPGVVHWFHQHQLAALALKIVLGVIVGLLTAYYAKLIIVGIATRLQAGYEAIAAAATWAWDAALTALWITWSVLNGVIGVFTALLDALGIGELLLLIAALAAGIYLLITHFHDVVNAVKAAFAFIVSIIGDAVRWIGQHWKLLVAILLLPFTIVTAIIYEVFVRPMIALVKVLISVLRGIWHAVGPIIEAPFKLAWTVIKAIFGALRAATHAVVGAVHAVWSTLVGILSGPFKVAEGIIHAVLTGIESAAKTVWGFFKGVWQTISGVVEAPFKAAASIIAGVFGSLKTAVVGVANWVIDRWNGLPFIHGFDVGPIHIPGLPTFHHIGAAMGGGISRSGWFDVGEQGRERVFLPRGSNVVPSGAMPGGGPITLRDEIKLYMDTRLVGRALVQRSLQEAALR